ncbi:CCQ_1a_G0036610.mRNA.1.CDS.1 [Saccharomyces cerevisiae]|nr:CCQ_1a_G0036610.mRNA.1.CDS.1 [Saccharomyces cerevisiae]CAI7387052.1 CCQ_1a_G0036610.mRNA.1.CDS.1 [Saccharomyces cerevisiae]
MLLFSSFFSHNKCPKQKKGPQPLKVVKGTSKSCAKQGKVKGKEKLWQAKTGRLVMSETGETSEYYKQALEEYKEVQEDEDPDAWDTRISKTGCYVENLALQLCHAETGDWRQCFNEMALFRKCWEKNGNKERVSTVDVDGTTSKDSEKKK